MSRHFVLLLVALSLACATKPKTPSFAYCPPAKFANCTVAKCELTDKGYACWCFEDDRYSATAWVGSQAKSCLQPAGNELQSRFHPTAAYQECGTNAPVQQWAWCLGVKCTRAQNPNDPNSTANVRCECTAIPTGVAAIPYVVTTNTYSAQNCAFRYWSSATPGDVSQITSFLQKQPGLGSLQQPVVLQAPK